jgi:hypothetical protein
MPDGQLDGGFMRVFLASAALLVLATAGAGAQPYDERRLPPPGADLDRGPPPPNRFRPPPPEADDDGMPPSRRRGPPPPDDDDDDDDEDAPPSRSDRL